MICCTRPNAVVIIAASMIWAGCGASRVIHVEPSDAEVVEIINRRAKTDRATLILKHDSPGIYAATSLVTIDRDSVRFIDTGGRVHTNSMSTLHELVFERNISFVGPGLGALAGGILGGLIYVRTRDRGGDVVISDGETFVVGFAGGVLPGAVIGGIIAAVLGSPRTVYRFNRDSPKQVSVVIGVGPMTTPCGSVE